MGTENPDDAGQAGDGASGTAGNAGTSGSSGSGGPSGGAGASGNGGTSGAAGTSGNGGTSGNAGTSGDAGSAGVAGTGGGGYECETADDCVLVADCCRCAAVPVGKNDTCPAICTSDRCSPDNGSGDAPAISADDVICKAGRCAIDRDCGPALCDSIPQPCPDGEVRSVLNGCYGQCLALTECRDFECIDGDVRPAGDGCNTCSCRGGRWACTEKNCPACEPGTSISSWDGCNTCTCNDRGEFLCNEAFCEVCPVQEPGACRLPWGYIRHEASGQCCYSWNLCDVPEGWEVAGSYEQCMASPCEPWHMSCDANPVNGCEVDVASSPENCGACGRACDLQNVAVHVCEEQNCAIAQCDEGFLDCNNDVIDGCEDRASRCDEEI